MTLIAGLQTVTVLALDRAGNEGEDVIDVTLAPPETNPLIVANLGPAADATFVSATGSLELTGTATDAVGVVSVRWRNNLGGSGPCTGTTSWACAVTLVSGPQTITVRAFDAAGNAGGDDLEVTYLPAAAPVVTISSPTTGTSYLTSSRPLALEGTAALEEKQRQRRSVHRYERVALCRRPLDEPTDDHDRSDGLREQPWCGHVGRELQAD
ncbi:MAG: hypothetical protein HYV07_20385 [Deltaproteobacteria bacterium]|nr:hypothetical protein [Deltaproteobacteria bacterium]